MTLTRDTVANFIGGISQQPEKLMYPNQSKRLVNYLLSPYEGLKDRPPTEYIAKLSNTLSDFPYIHWIMKEDEKYIVIMTGSTVKVYDIEGTEKTVTINSNAEAYITNTSPYKNFYLTTIGDYTFILNKTKKTALTSDTYTNSFASSALIFVKQGDYATDYVIKVNNETVASYTTENGSGGDDRESTKTNTIASELYEQLQTNLGTNDWEFHKQGSVFSLKKRDGSSFTIQALDSNSSRNLYAFYGSADSLDLLPLIAPKNFMLKINGENANKVDDYYVKFTTADGSSFGSGSWQECPAEGIKYKLDASTMPHLLVRNADGTFTVKRATWGNRKCGDTITAPDPSFIGKKIQDVFTHKGRLGFLAEDKSVYSDTQNIFSFFKRTTRAELDTDPIDVGSNSKMVDLRHSLPYNEQLLLFSEKSIFSIKGGDIFSNSTVACDLSMEYPCSRLCKPVNAGATSFFTYENGDYTQVKELFITQSYTIDAREITEQVPSYIPKNVYKIACSTANNIACFLSYSKKDSIYVYNYYYNATEKVQSAWSRWYFKDAEILSAEFDENLLYIVMQYSDGVYLVKMDFAAQRKEANLDYLFYLDRKLYYTNQTVTNNTVTINLPYIPDTDSLLVLNNKGFPQDYTISNKTLTINTSETSLIIGQTFASSWTLPTIYVRHNTNNGMKVREGILMLRDINLTYSNTGYFRVVVTPKYSTNITSTFEYTGKILGMTSATVGEINVSSGTFLLPVLAKNEEITIRITNDSYKPSCFLSLEWLGDFTFRGE